MSETKSQKNAPRAFICHAFADKSRFVTDFATRLREAGVDAWYDDWELKLGDSLTATILGDLQEDGAISQARHFIVVVSTNSLESNWVQAEIQQAQTLNIAGRNRVIPVVLGLEYEDMPPVLYDSKWIKIDDLDDYDQEFQEIVNTIFDIEVKPPLGESPSHQRSQIYGDTAINIPHQLIARLEADVWDWEQAPQEPTLRLKLAAVDTELEIEAIRFDTRVGEDPQRGPIIDLEKPRRVLPGKLTPIDFDLSNLARALRVEHDIMAAKELRAVAIDVLGRPHESDFIEIHKQWNSLVRHGYHERWKGTPPRLRPELHLGYVETTELTKESDPELYEQVTALMSKFET